MKLNNIFSLLNKHAQILIVLLFFWLITNNAFAINKVTNDIQTINASILHPTNGKIHFFIGQFFHQYNPMGDKLEKMGRIGKDGWYGLAPNVNAAIIHPQNKKAYFFIGNMYHRYDFSKKRVDKKGVIGQDGWRGLVGPVDVAIMHPTNNSAYFFKGKKYYRFNFSKDKVDKVGTIGVDGWKGLPANIHGATMHTNGKAYFFKEDQYYRYAFGRGVDKRGIIGRDGWKGLFHKIDAIVENKEKIHFFKEGYVLDIKPYNDNFYVREILKRTPSKRNILQSNIKSIALTLSPNVDKAFKKKLGYESYKGVPKNVNAALLHPKNKKYYFFKDSKYYRYDTSKRVVDKTGTIGRDGWRGVPTNVDAAVVVKNDIYFFKGTKYYIYKSSSRGVTESGNITSKFKGVPNYLDAVHCFENKRFGWTTILFVKKDVIYKYSISDNKVIDWELLNQSLFK